ncbi:MAG: type III-B CRISPR module RAMP protein Cmr4 [Deltaproteobacteria bacterium]|nr:type III-B CRISPR module RAMP protein Cmr4 [Deltaproteobacteria bacterium]
MFKREKTSLCVLYAISPIHAGSGMSTGAVDLPIQRERHTNWPVIQASGVKGAFRAHCRDFAENKDLLNVVFGSDSKEATPSAVSISDARLLAFPVRSNIAPFVWVVSPALLGRLKTDLSFAGMDDTGEIPNVAESDAILIRDKNQKPSEEKLILEDSALCTKNGCEIPFLKNLVPETTRLYLVSDQIFDHLVSHCTEVQTHINIDSETGTAKGGALWYAEYLPSDTVMYVITYYSRAQDVDVETIHSHVRGAIKDFIQIGGDETTGKGLCRVSWLNGGAA